MIKIILKDKLNPYRAETCVFKTYKPMKAILFIKVLKSNLLYDYWEIKTSIGGMK